MRTWKKKIVKKPRNEEIQYEWKHNFTNEMNIYFNVFNSVLLLHIWFLPLKIHPHTNAHTLPCSNKKKSIHIIILLIFNKFMIRSENVKVYTNQISGRCKVFQINTNRNEEASQNEKKRNCLFQRKSKWRRRCWWWQTFVRNESFNSIILLYCQLFVTWQHHNLNWKGRRLWLSSFGQCLILFHF